MGSQRLVLGLVLMAVAGTAAAQASGMLRWRANHALGLQAGTAETRLPCSSYTLACTDAASVPLYTSVTAPRTLSMQVSPDDRRPALGLVRTPGLNVSVVGKAGIAPELGVYGRVGTTFNRASTQFAGAGPADGGLTYGVGLSWDFARSASASMGLDSYDMRTTFGDSRELRTSLGLQWRY